MSDRQLYKRLLQMLWDCFSWAVATLIVVGSRYEFTLTATMGSSIYRYVAGVCLLQILVGTVLMLYRGRYRTASFDESLGLALTVALVGAGVGLLFLASVGQTGFPRALAVLTPPVALLSMAAGRWVFRAVKTVRSGCEGSVKVIIYGAGDAGYQLV